MTEPMLRLEGIEKIEVMELEEALGSSVAQVKKPSPGDTDRHDDLGLTAVVIVLGPVALAGLAAYLLKKRVWEIEEAQDGVEIKPDGTIVVNLKKIRTTKSSAPPDKGTIKSLTAGLQALVDKAGLISGGLGAGTASGV